VEPDLEPASGEVVLHPACRATLSEPPRVVGYLRVSTERQATDGLSIEAQQARITSYCELYGLALVAVHCDPGASGSNLERAGLRSALADLAAGEASGIVVARLDRLTRSVRDLGLLIDEHFSDGGADLMSVSEQIDTRTAGGRLVLHVLMSVAQWEREIIGERTAAALAVKAARGEYTGGGVPYGRSLAEGGVRLIEEPGELQILTKALELRGRGLSLRAVAEALGALGYLSRTGRVLSPEQVARMLRRAIAWQLGSD